MRPSGSETELVVRVMSNDVTMMLTVNVLTVNVFTVNALTVVMVTIMLDS